MMGIDMEIYMRNIILKASRHGMFAPRNKAADKTTDYFMAAAVGLGFLGFQLNEHGKRKEVDTTSHSDNEVLPISYKP